jgi:hypothetical protein
MCADSTTLAIYIQPPAKGSKCMKDDKKEILVFLVLFV